LLIFGFQKAENPRGNHARRANHHYALVHLPGSQIKIAATQVASPAGPLQRSVFSFDIVAGVAGSKGKLICSMTKDGQPFGEESLEATIVFVSTSEAPACENIRNAMLKIQEQIALLEDQLDATGNPHSQSQLRNTILKAKEELKAERNRGVQLQCSLP